MGECLPLPHGGEIAVRLYAEYLQHPPHHLAMLSRQTHAHVVSPRRLQSVHERTHLDRLGSRAENYSQLFHHDLPAFLLILLILRQKHRQYVAQKRKGRFLKKVLTNEMKLAIIIWQTRKRVVCSTEKYSRGRRGAPAKGVGRYSRRESSNLSFSAKKKSRVSGFFFLYSSLFSFHSSLFFESPGATFPEKR